MEIPKLIFDTNVKDLYKNMNISNKNRYGEVFTPIELIEEMLDNLPKRVWSNPKYKWLDPCAGTGNFSLFIFHKLMEGLKQFEPNQTKRAIHIVKNMLYMVEINTKNAQIIKYIFGKNVNLHVGDFLEFTWKQTFQIFEFDIILANPPWNDSKDVRRVGTNSGAKSLYDKFALYSLEHLKPNGYMGFIHPANWRGLGRHHHMFEQLSKKQILYIHIYSKKEGFEIFDINSRFDLYILQNKSNTKATKIIDEKGQSHSIDILSMPFIPNYAFSQFQQIFTNPDEGIKVIHDNFYSTHKTNKIMSQTKNGVLKYPVIHTITKKGVSFYYTSDKSMGHFGIPKVVLSFNEKQYAHSVQNDYNGKLGMSQICFGIPIKSEYEGQQILKAIETPLFKMLIDSTKWSLYQTDYRMFKYLRPDFYQFFVNSK